MTDKELRKLSRVELVEILVYLRKEIDALKQENQELRQRLGNSFDLPEDFMQKLEQMIKNTVEGCIAEKNGEQ